jgi:hypothetical protein
MLTGTFARLFGCLCLLGIGMVASHAESAGPDDVTITDTTDYRYCVNGADQGISPARPPYYVALLCVDSHSSNPFLHPRCYRRIYHIARCKIASKSCKEALPRVPSVEPPRSNMFAQKLTNMASGQ